MNVRPIADCGIRVPELSNFELLDGDQIILRYRLIML